MAHPGYDAHNGRLMVKKGAKRGSSLSPRLSAPVIADADRDELPATGACHLSSGMPKTKPAAILSRPRGEAETRPLPRIERSLASDGLERLGLLDA